MRRWRAWGATRATPAGLAAAPVGGGRGGVERFVPCSLPWDEQRNAPCTSPSINEEVRGSGFEVRGSRFGESPPRTPNLEPRTGRLAEQPLELLRHAGEDTARVL